MAYLCSPRTAGVYLKGSHKVVVWIGSPRTCGGIPTCPYDSRRRSVLAPNLRAFDLGDNAFVVKAGQHLDGTTTSGSATPTRSGASAQSQPVATSEPTPEPEAPTVQEPTEPPSTPTNLTAAVNDDGSITLSWDTPDDDTITGYEILRRRPTEGERRLTTYVANTDTTYTDANVTSGVRHVYRVKAINTAGVGPQSNYVQVQP